MASLILEGRVRNPEPIKKSSAGKKDPHNTLFIPKNITGTVRKTCQAAHTKI